MRDTRYPNSLKPVWIGSTVILFLVAGWMLWHNETTTGVPGPGKYHAGTGRSQTIDCRGVLLFAIIFLIVAIFLFWPQKKKPGTES
jgi:hypothetical protein